MTREEGNLVGENVRMGDRVTVNQTLTHQYRLNTNDTFDLEPGEQFTVTRVGLESLNIRTVGTKRVRDTSSYNSHHNQVLRQVSFSVSRHFLTFHDADYVPPPPPRKLGTMPEGEEELINIDDPRIQWLFDDMGKYADGKGWCPQYDQLCKDLGIPGRPQDYHVTRTLNGIQIRATIKARSQAEANQMFATAMAVPTEPTEPDYTPAA